MIKKKIMGSVATASTLLVLSGFAYSEDGSVTSTPVVAPVLEVYQNGLMATVFIEDKATGTWASPNPVGTPVGEFVDSKVPAFSFANLKQDETAWSLYPGSHVGVLWNGYFYADEPGSYVLMIDWIKEDGTSYHANSCVADLRLSDKSILKHDFKYKTENSYIGSGRVQETRTISVKLEEGYYPMELWLHCGVTTGEWGNWANDDAGQAIWTLKVKKPSDRFVKIAPPGLLVWK